VVPWTERRTIGPLEIQHSTGVVDRGRVRRFAVALTMSPIKQERASAECRSRWPAPVHEGGEGDLSVDNPSSCIALCKDGGRTSRPANHGLWHGASPDGTHRSVNAGGQSGRPCQLRLRRSIPPFGRPSVAISPHSLAPWSCC